MFLRSLLRASAAAASPLRPSLRRSFAVKPSNLAKDKNLPKPKFNPKGQKEAAAEPSAKDPEYSAKKESELRRRFLVEDDKNPALDVGPSGGPLFTDKKSISLLTKEDACTYMKFSMEELREVLPEGLPLGMLKEFEESYRSALLIRESFIDLCENFKRAADPTLLVNSKAPKVRKQVVLDGPVSSGKSIVLAMLVHWARTQGWLVLYIPKGRDWTHGGLFYKNPHTGLWDTPVQASNILQDFLKYNKPHLQGLKCNINEPIPLGEGAGIGWPKGNDNLEIPNEMTLCELVEVGIKNTHAAVGVAVRLRKELSKATSVPVLIAIDQYNSWFTFSDFEEPVTVRSCRPVHARELAIVKAFRPMTNDDMIVGAFSHSTAVGKLRQELPDVPADARINLPRYNLDEAATVCHYYLRQRLVQREAFTEANWKKIFYLSNGNGTEMRYLVPFMR